MGASSSSRSTSKTRIRISDMSNLSSWSTKQHVESDETVQTGEENKYGGGLTNQSSMLNPYVAPRLRTRKDPDEHYLEAIGRKNIEISFVAQKEDKIKHVERCTKTNKKLTMLSTKAIRKMKERIYGQVIPDLELPQLSKKKMHKSPEKCDQVKESIQMTPNNDENINM